MHHAFHTFSSSVSFPLWTSFFSWLPPWLSLMSTELEPGRAPLLDACSSPWSVTVGRRTSSCLCTRRYSGRTVGTSGTGRNWNPVFCVCRYVSIDGEVFWTDGCL